MSIDEKGQPMSKREAAIEAMARAIDPPAWEPSPDMPVVLMHELRQRSNGLAATALDAALSVLSEPDERMVEAAVKAGDDYYLGDNIVWDEIPVMFTAMLSTLRSPEK